MLELLQKYVSLENKSHTHVKEKIKGLKTYDEHISVLIKNNFLISPVVKKALKDELNGKTPKGSKDAQTKIKEIEDINKLEQEALAKGKKDGKAEAKKEYDKNFDEAVNTKVAEAMDAYKKELEKGKKEDSKVEGKDKHKKGIFTK